MYIPYALVYYVQRVYIMCKVNYACTTLTLTDYMTDEIIVMLVGILLHIPFWFFMLLIIDIKKSGGRVSDAFKFFKVVSCESRRKCEFTLLYFSRKRMWTSLWMMRTS